MKKPHKHVQKSFNLGPFDLRYEHTRHYTGSWHWCFAPGVWTNRKAGRHFEFLELYHSWDDYGKHYFRFCLLTWMAIGLFLKWCNYLHGRGWELTVFPMRYGIHRLSFSIGRSDSRDLHTPWPGVCVIHRWRGWAFCDHNSEYQFPEPEYREYLGCDDQGTPYHEYEE